MRRTTCLLLFFFTIIFAGYSQPRTETEVQNIASDFYKKVIGTPATRSLTATGTLKLAHRATSQNSHAYYYVFNAGNKNGFVIVSGDSRANEILGYSLSGDFSIDSIPSNLRNWLGVYQKELQYLMDNTTTSSASSTLKTVTGNSELTTVSPMLGQTKWNQGTPYNQFCPKSGTKSTYTGCVATAIAQIMKYHQYPTTGTGKKTYTTESLSKQLTVDFSATTYDWTNMVDTYTGAESDIQKNAVATLMYHCGIAANMDYGTSGSAAYDEDAAIGLIKYFGYDSNLRTLYRDYYTAGEWEAILKNELINGRPVLYGGGTVNNEGHAFVCDGYNEENLYHFNWGWNGYADGYFALTSLKPISSDTGTGYTVAQDMTIGIQKPSSTSKPSYQLLLNDQSVMTFATDMVSQKSFTLSVPFYNAGITQFNGKTAVGLYQESNLIAALGETAVSMAGFDYGYFEDKTVNYSGLSLPAGISSGSFQLYSIYKGSDETSWSKMRALENQVSYFNILVTDGMITQKNESSTGILRTTNNKVNIYPNSAADYLYINSEEQVKSVQITDLSGKQVLTLTPLTNGQITVPVTELNKGLYLLLVNTENQQITSKFIKK